MSKKPVNKVLLGSATVLALGLSAQQIEAATTNVKISAAIVGPISVTQTRVLNFGLLTETGAGTFQVDNTDTGTPSGTITSVGGTVQAGGFQIKGTKGTKVDVTVPASASITHTTSVAAKMTVNSFTIDGAVAAAATPFTDTLATATNPNYRLGGTLNIGAGQKVGVYQGTVKVTANYQ